MSGLTSIPKRQLGEVRFPTVESPPGEVVTYTLSQEEIEEKYGPSMSSKLPRKKLEEYRRKGYSRKEIAELSGLTEKEVQQLNNYYRMNSGKGGSKVTKIKREDFTKEMYLEMKEKGMTDLEVRNQVEGLHNARLYNLKIKWGLVKPQQRRSSAPKKQVDKPKVEQPTSVVKNSVPKQEVVKKEVATSPNANEKLLQHLREENETLKMEIAEMRDWAQGRISDAESYIKILEEDVVQSQKLIEELQAKNTQFRETLKLVL